MNFDSLSRFLVSYRHWTFYPVMCFARINLFSQSIIVLANKKVPDRNQEILGLEPATDFPITQLGRARDVYRGEVLRYRNPAYSVLLESFFLLAFTCRSTHGQRLVRKADVGHSEYLLLVFDGLVPRGPSVSSGASSLPAIPQLPSEEDSSFSEGAL